MCEESRSYRAGQVGCVVGYRTFPPSLGRVAVAQRAATNRIASVPSRSAPVALSDIDRNLLDRCLNGKPRAWEDFVDRFTGLVVHVITHTAQCRSIRISNADREDLAA